MRMRMRLRIRRRTEDEDKDEDDDEEEEDEDEDVAEDEANDEGEDESSSSETDSSTDQSEDEGYGDRAINWHGLPIDELDHTNGFTNPSSRASKRNSASTIPSELASGLPQQDQRQSIVLLNINRDQDIHGVYHDPPETEKLQHAFLDDEPMDKELSFAKTPGMNHM